MEEEIYIHKYQMNSVNAVLVNQGIFYMPVSE